VKLGGFYYADTNGVVMSEELTQNQLSWSDQTLQQMIMALKSKREYRELKGFLRSRIEDADPCCSVNRPKLWNELGLVFLEEDNPEEADLCFVEALKIDHANVTAAYNMANIKLHHGLFDKAIDLYERVLVMEPDFVGAQINKALCLLYSERCEDARPLFEQAASMQPGNHPANYWAGEISLRLGDFAVALPFFKQAYALQTNHFETVNGYAMTLLGAEQYEEAAAICDQSLMSVGPSVVALRTKSDAMLALNKVQDAVLCHLDIAYLDLDARDAIVSRLQALYEEDKAKFQEYKKYMMDRSPEFEPLLSVVRQYEGVAENQAEDCHGAC
jgi:tetratricopeptide (TPR) repeat protein